MGNIFEKEIDYNKIYTIDEIYDLFILPNKKYSTFKLMSDMNVQNPKVLKIFICNDFCEKNAEDNEHKKDIEEDYILSHGKYQYYVAELCLKQTGYFGGIANILWNKIDDVFSFSCNIVKYHKNYPKFKKYYILKYFTPDRYNRYNKNNKYTGITYDLDMILNKLKKISYDDIHNYCIEQFEKKKQYENILNICKKDNIEVPNDIECLLKTIENDEILLEQINKYLYDFYHINNPDGKNML